MTRSMLRRFGVFVAGFALVLTGLASPAQATGDGTITGQLTDGGVAVSGGGAVYLYGDDVDHWDFSSLDGQGRYTFNAVPPGHYRVDFEAAGHPSQWAYGKTSWSSADLVTVTSGGTTVVDDQLLPVGTITGRLVDRSGNPMPSVFVGAQSVDYTSYGYASTGADGTFTMPVLPGRYTVRFEIGSFGQYAYGTLDLNDATVFSVTAGSTVTVDDTLVAVGSVAGRLTDRSGAPASDVQVYVSNGQFFGYAQTDADGRYRVDTVPAGSDYTVEFYDYERSIQQYAVGAVDISAATHYTVTEDNTTTVDDQLLPTGSVRLTAVDSRTGQPIQDFWSNIGMASGETDTGELVLPAVQAGTYQIMAGATGYSFDGASVTVTADQQTDVTLVMKPRPRITATVVDAATGAPLAGVCIVPVRADAVRMPGGCGGVTGPDGKVTTWISQGAGTYQLMAWPAEAAGYGAQWLGPHGGTGDLRHASTFTVDAGDLVTPPVIRMDRAGVVTGQVFGPDGGALASGTVRIAGEAVGMGGGLGAFDVDSTGHYRIDVLGPYQWPLLFDVVGQATQWSGGTANRNQADEVTVTSGHTTTYDYRLDAGVTATVRSTGPAGGRVVAFNADTGDIVGMWDAADLTAGASTPLIGGQEIRFAYYTADGSGTMRYVGGTDLASASTYEVPKKKDVTFELTLG
jgi:5-hydroxyisourate hydrolase-like protein (transthyretin family)